MSTANGNDCSTPSSSPVTQLCQSTPGRETEDHHLLVETATGRSQWGVRSVLYVTRIKTHSSTEVWSGSRLCLRQGGVDFAAKLVADLRSSRCAFVSYLTATLLTDMICVLRCDFILFFTIAWLFEEHHLIFWILHLLRPPQRMRARACVMCVITKCYRLLQRGSGRFEHLKSEFDWLHVSKTWMWRNVARTGAYECMKRPVWPVWCITSCNPTRLFLLKAFLKSLYIVSAFKEPWTQTRLRISVYNHVTIVTWQR